ncbi:TPA: metal-dependent hydrolase [Clostridium perfringens]
MLYKTHLTTSAAIAIPTLAAVNELSVVTVLGVAIGSLLPDIDTPKSFVGRRLYPIAYIINKTFGHRGVIHSLLPIILIGGLAIFFKSLFIGAIAFGFFLHLVEDTFSRKGIKWFAPINDIDIKMPFEFLTYETGSLKEYAILGIALIIVFLEIHKGNLVAKSMMEVNSMISSLNFTSLINSILH